MKGYPRSFLRLLHTTVALVVLSGLLLVPTLLLIRAELEPGSLVWFSLPLPAAGRVVTAAVHAGTGMVLLALCGALWSVHMRAGWRLRRHRVSGSLLAAAMAVLALSALALYYLGDEALAAAAAFLHLGVGLGLILAFGWHAQTARRRAAAARIEPVQQQRAGLQCAGEAPPRDAGVRRG